MTLILAYDRVERASQHSDGRMVAEWQMAVHKAPVMPHSISELEKGKRWQRKSVGKAGVVLETWRLIEAA
ncbi:MAG: hypothetical protein AB7E72_16130 [Lysobacterales bacterium]